MTAQNLPIIAGAALCALLLLGYLLVCVAKRTTKPEPTQTLTPEQWAVVNLIALRRDRSLSPKQLADRMGTSLKTVLAFERGAWTPTLHFLERVASALDAQIEIHIRRQQ